MTEYNTTITNSTGTVFNWHVWHEAILIIINIFLPPFLIIFGLIGNCLSLYVFYKSDKKIKTSANFLMKALAFSDSGFLIFFGPAEYAFNGIKNNLLEQPERYDMYMMARTYLRGMTRIGQFTGIWFICAITVDR